MRFEPLTDQVCERSCKTNRIMESNDDRMVLEVRELLRKQRNKDVLVNYYVNRGMTHEDARDLVISVYKGNLSINRKSSLGIMIGGGIGTAIFLAIWLGAGRLFVIWLPLCGIAFLTGLVKFLTASGYEVDDDD